jgi:LEA14-like dessication related protein
MVPISAVIRARLALVALGVFLLAGCAGLQGPQPVEVILVGVEPLKSEGLELRMLAKLRVQNPNDQPLEFNGVAVRLDVQGRRFATGVSDAARSVPRFGETVIAVPVSIPVLRIAQQAIGVLSNEYRGRLAYEMAGQLAGPAFGSVRFKSAGELTLPAQLFEGGR